MTVAPIKLPRLGGHYEGHVKKWLDKETIKRSVRQSVESALPDTEIKKTPFSYKSMLFVREQSERYSKSKIDTSENICKVQ